MHIDQPQAMLGDGVVQGKNLNKEFHNQWKPKQPSGRAKVVRKVPKSIIIFGAKQ